MTYLDRLSILNAGGLSMFIAGGINSIISSSEINYIVASAGTGLAISTIVAGMLPYEDSFEELREEFNRRERQYNKNKK